MVLLVNEVLFDCFVCFYLCVTFGLEFCFGLICVCLVVGGVCLFVGLDLGLWFLIEVDCWLFSLDFVCCCFVWLVWLLS